MKISSSGRVLSCNKFSILDGHGPYNLIKPFFFFFKSKISFNKANKEFFLQLYQTNSKSYYNKHKYITINKVN